MSLILSKSGYSTEVSGYVDTSFKKECQTCEHFKGPNLCNNKLVQTDPALFTDPKSGLKLVSPKFGCCNEWEPDATEPTNLVYVVRHGETKLNATNKFRGNVDVDISSKGVKQAQYLRAFLSGIPFERFLSSDKLRAMHTLDIILGDTGSYEPTPALRALNVGKFSGLERSPENLKELEYYIKHPSETIPDGESLQDFRDRVRPALKDASFEAIATGKPVFILAHSSIVHEVGSMLHSDPNSVLVDPGGVTVISRTKSGKLDARAILNERAAAHSADVVS